ncbi:hypothetical protein GCT13_04065 [Paraburkholderia sp. CNPSo 3157]|uniref:Uncharacterized protein n=1 Tax=Paraburkholderia franconis TaxID=2654983 RepID=A0A7X1TEC7_9BURK|nr:hypothetical protein [Paraburkholderia franconis]
MGNWSVVNRSGKSKSAPENFPVDSAATERRSGLDGNSLISLEVLRAVQHGGNRLAIAPGVCPEEGHSAT